MRNAASGSVFAQASFVLGSEDEDEDEDEDEEDEDLLP
jgi:hypothetical protein